MKKILFIFLLVTSFLPEVFSQSQDLDKYVWYRYSYGIRYPRIQVDSVFGLPIQDTTWTPDTLGVMLIHPVSKLLYYYNGTYWAGTGTTATGSTNSNIGSAYRWAVPGTNNIKTFANGYGFLLDSATTNILTGMADTTHGYGVVSYAYAQFLMDSLNASGATIDNHAVDGFAIFDMSDPDYVWGKRLTGDFFINLDSSNSGINFTLNLDGLIDTIFSDLDTASLVIRNAGAGQQLWFNKDDTLTFKRFKDTLGVVWHTSPDSSLYAVVSLPAAGWNLTGNTLTGTGIIGSLSNHDFEFHTNSVKRMVLDKSGNFLFDTVQASPQYKFLVRDTAQFFQGARFGPLHTPGIGTGAGARVLIKGEGTSSGEMLFAVFNSGNGVSSRVLSVDAAGGISIPAVASTFTGALTLWTGQTHEIKVSNAAVTTGNYHLFSANTPMTATSATEIDFVSIGVGSAFSPASGSTIFNGLVIEPVIAQTGTASGHSRGLYINPNLTAALGEWEAMRIVTGTSYVRSLALTTAGDKITIKGGANASAGTATLVAGTVTVSTTAVSANSKIIVTVNTPGGTAGRISVPDASIVSGTSFIINSDNAADASTVNWWILDVN